jgi:hypothetical protein
METEENVEAKKREPDGPKAPQRYWWLVLVVVPIVVAALPLLKRCTEKKSEEGSHHTAESHGDKSPAVVTSGEVRIEYK